MTGANEQRIPEGTEDAGSLSSLEISIAGEKVEFTVPVPSGAATWEDLLPFMRALVKVSSDISQDYFAAQGKPISCRAGCGICCRQRVPIAEFEAHRLRRLVESMPEPRRSEIIARFYASEVRVREAGADVLYDDSEQMSIEEMTRRAGSYFRLMIPCPFLENESCSIYDERPLKCREYLVTSPAANCADPELLPVVGLPQPLAVYMTTLFLDEESRGPGIRWVPLNQLMSWTDSHSPATPEKTGPELLQEFMSRLVQRSQ